MTTLEEMAIEKMARQIREEARAQGRLDPEAQGFVVGFTRGFTQRLTKDFTKNLSRGDPDDSVDVVAKTFIEGPHLLVHGLLVHKLGALTDAQRAILDAATSKQLETFFDRIATADDTDAVLSP